MFHQGQLLYFVSTNKQSYDISRYLKNALVQLSELFCTVSSSRQNTLKVLILFSQHK